MHDSDLGLTFSFGDFVFDSQNGDLRKNGTRIRVNKQTSELLTVMLVNAGTLVTRSQIRETLWPEHQLSYEKAISNSMGKLRYIFRDDARKPRYIECIPKRGYRMVAEVRRTVITVPAKEPSSRELEATAAPEIEESSQLTTVAYIEPSAAVVESRLLANASKSSDLSHPSIDLDPAPSLLLRPYDRRLFAIALVLVLVVFTAYVSLKTSGKNAPPAAQPLAISHVVSLGIVPFETNSIEAEELGKSFRLDLTDALSQLPQVRMRAANSTGNLKLDSADLSVEAAQLHLDVILFGRLTTSAKDFHLQLEMVRSSDTTHLATFQYSGTKDELISVRDKIQQDIFSKLQLSAPERPMTGDTNNPQAYRAYLNGRYHYLLQTGDSLRQAVNDFNIATNEDPRFARAYAALGRTYLTMGNHDLIPQEEGFRKASQAIDKAQFLDPGLSDMHATRGLILLSRDWNVVASEHEIRQAIQLDPNQALYHQWMALVLAHRGQLDKAQEEIQIAHHDDPYSIPLLFTEIFLDQTARRYPQELANALKLNELMHNAPMAMDDLANALWSDGQYEAAIRKWREMAMAEKDVTRMEMEDRGLKAFRHAGVKAYALVRLDAIRSKTFPKLHSNDFSPAEWNATAGRNQEALATLRHGLLTHDPQFTSDIMNPALDPLRHYAEYKEILAQSHLK